MLVRTIPKVINARFMSALDRRQINLRSQDLFDSAYQGVSPQDLVRLFPDQENVSRIEIVTYE
jgi:hypothetical protein